MYDTIKQWTCRVGRVDKLYAFAYQPPPPEREFNGWDLYNPRKEWERQGVDKEGNGWRISQINSDYGVGLHSSVGVFGVELPLTDLDVLF